MFNPFAANDYQSKNLDADQIRLRYKFKLPHYLLLGTVGFTIVRGYGYLFSCHRLTFNPIFDGFWALWLLLLAVPIAMGFINKYAGNDPVQPWQISMFVALVGVAILACVGAALGGALCLI